MSLYKGFAFDIYYCKHSIYNLFFILGQRLVYQGPSV